jgi:hypothetical protein
MKRLFIAAAFWAALVGQANAWDAHGHMEVAAVAWLKLSPSAKAKAAKLLEYNPLKQQWIDEAPQWGMEPAAVMFLRAATWPDLIRGGLGYQDDGNRPPPGPASGQNIGYGDKLMHKYWHFVDTPFSPDGTDLEPIPKPNAKTQIELFRTALATSKDDGIRSYDLVWLLHLVGDVHQPLHATNRFTEEMRHGDNGGNSEEVAVATCHKAQCAKVPLHTFWDDLLSPKKEDGSADKAAITPKHAMDEAKALSPADAKAAAVTDVGVWLQESFDLATRQAYREKEIGTGTGPFHISANYQAASETAAKARVALAGARLAHLIEEALK